MKKIFLNLVVFLCVFYGSAQETGFEAREDWEEDVVVEEVEVLEDKIAVNWENTFKEAVVKAKETHKPILIYFTGSDWCGPCKRIDENLFHTEKFVKFSEENLVLYTADFPRNTDLVSEENKKMNKQLSKKYNQESFPTMIIVDERGYVLARRNGSYMVDSYFPFFEKHLRNY